MTENNDRKLSPGFLISLVGFIATSVSMFLPCYSNPNISGSLIQLMQNVGSLLPIVAVAGIILGILGTLYILKGKNAKVVIVSAALRVAASLIAAYAMFGVYKKMTAGATPDEVLAVTVLFGAWLFIVGLAIGLFGAIKDFSTVQVKKWSTVDLVLIVMTAALYAAALLSLTFIKLAPGTWLRPGNALQAPFGILFGIPGSIGIGLGNLIADLSQGTAPHVMVLGMIVNFGAAFLPYLFVSNARIATRKSVVEFVVWAVIIAGSLPALSIWINVLAGLTPKAVALAFGPVVFLNQVVSLLLLGIPLTKLLYPFVVRSGLYRGRDAALDK